MKPAIALFPVLAVALLLAGAPAQASSKMDNRIEASAKKSYVFNTYLKGDDIKIQSRDGVVTLTGSVLEESHKSLAQETVAELPGVKKVDNKLEVKGDSPAVNSDLWLATKVKTTLLFHRNVNALKTEVSVKDAVVTLRGDAASEAQKELTTEYAKDVTGVKDVMNEMTVSGASTRKDESVGGKIDDASITAQVKIVLLYHRSTSAVRTKVKTKNGVVTLSGEAGNAAEKALVTKLAGDVHGVKNVTNRMTVTGSK
ncbi:BON domain-containing protein [Candidatus Deferrimicrobium sp.]|uniref:BON domain-containing protein n=1 Tax=Candidatus Deferrimicrobium sp. TaxID=3060586 RepID=UPI003C5F433A